MPQVLISPRRRRCPRMAALPQGCRGQRGPAAEHLARDDAGQLTHAEAQPGAHGRFSNLLEEQAEKEPATYEKFYEQYSRF